MNNLYDKEYLQLTISIIEDNIHDLWAWNAYNDDEFIDEIAALEDRLTYLKSKVEGQVNTK